MKFCLRLCLKEEMGNIQEKELKKMEQQYNDEAEKLKENFESESIVMQNNIKDNVAKISHLTNKNKEKTEELDKLSQKYKWKELKIKKQNANITNMLLFFIVKSKKLFLLLNWEI